MKKIPALLLLLLMCSGAQSETTSSKDIAGDIIGRHLFALQWISDWEKNFGAAVIEKNDGVITINAKEREGEDYIILQGTIEIISNTEFKVNGSLVTRVSYLNTGDPCERNGIFTFKKTGKKKYYRMQEMESPCGAYTDYVDIFLN